MGNAKDFALRHPLPGAPPAMLCGLAEAPHGRWPRWSCWSGRARAPYRADARAAPAAPVAAFRGRARAAVEARAAPAASVAAFPVIFRAPAVRTATRRPRARARARAPAGREAKGAATPARAELSTW